jgi:hypothetical protein
LTGSGQLLLGYANVFRGEKPQPTGDFELRVEFRQGCNRNSHMIQVASTRAARVPLRNVRRDRDSRTAKLCSKYETFRCGQPGDHRVSGQHQVHRGVPHEKVAEALNRCHDVSFSAARISLHNADFENLRV